MAGFVETPRSLGELAGDDEPGGLEPRAAADAAEELVEPIR